VSLAIEHAAVTAQVGDKVGFDTLVRNDSDQPASDLVAHLDIVSTEPGTYVDPEDWSQERTQYLPAIPAHGTRRVHWDVRVVNDGSFAIYVALTSRHGDAGAMVASNTLRLAASATTPINPSGALPVVLGIPAFLALLLVGTRLRRRVVAHSR
jgi:hypothetical protein